MVSVVSSVDTAHEDMLHDAALDYYGLRLATCSSDHSVKVFQVRADGAHALAVELKGHSAPVWQVAWAHPSHGALLASCSYDRKVIIWKETSKWGKAYEYAGHESSVNSIAWAPPEYGALLACASSDGSVSILSPSAGGGWEACKIPGAHAVGCNAVGWAPALAVQDKPAPKRLITGGSDNLVKIWIEEGDRWVEENRLEIHTDWIRDVAWAPSVGLPRSIIASCSQDKRVVIWTSEDNVSWTSTILHTFDDVVWSVSWSLTGNILAVSGGDNKVSLWRENNEGQWVCISEVARGVGNLSNDEGGLN